ncbi:hypothetical protein D9M68_684000 [compost metagenome]
MVDEGEVARHLGHELDDGRAAWRYQGGLHILLIMAATIALHAVEDCAYHMKTGGQVGATDAEEHPHFFTDIGGQRVLAGQGAIGTVKQDIGRFFIDGFLHVEVLQAFGTVSARGIEIALHHVVLTVNLGHALFGLDQDHAVHAIGHMHAHRCRGAVIDIQPGSQCLEGEHRLVARGDQGLLGTATRTTDGM